MKKEEVIYAIKKIIEQKSKKLNLEVENKGIGHAFDHTVWKGIAIDDSGIPNIVAKRHGYKIELRSFWGNPELSIRTEIGDNHELFVLVYSDEYLKEDGLIHSGDYKVEEVRYNGNNYKEGIKLIYDLIDEIEKEAN